MKISKGLLGIVDEHPVELYTLENDSGVIVKITNYGGIVTSIILPDGSGNTQDVVCGFDTLEGYFSEEYKANSPYFGCIVGRYAARIKDGQFNIGEVQYQLDTNDGTNHLHGGKIGFDKRVWEAKTLEKQDRVQLILTLSSQDGDQHYPGNVDVTITYSLTQSNALEIQYEAETDAQTPLSLTNHTYFNLGGFQKRILDHQAQIHSNRYLIPDDSNVPVGEEAMVAGTACDFNTPKRIGDSFSELPNGFEHYYVFENEAGDLIKVAEFSDPDTGRTLSVLTTEPGMLFYTGLYTSDNLAREDGTAFGQFKAFCCETSKYPNGPNIKGSPRSVLNPEQEYSELTIYQFSW